METAKAKGLAIEMMKTAKAAYVTTIGDEGFPMTRAMFNLRRNQQFPALEGFFKGYEQNLTTYFTTNTSSSKVKHIRENPKVSVYYCEPAKWRGLLLVGEMEIIVDPQIKRSIWQKGWEMYYPGGPEDPDHTVLRLAPRNARYYHSLDVTNMVFDK